jgi:prepilin-type N-terminal cleavage/methylation domain-containing protein
MNQAKYGFGFTLVELVIVVALVGVLSLVVTGLFIGQNRIYKTQTAELGVNAGARNALDDIDFFVRTSSGTLASYSSFTAGSDTLILQVQSINASEQLIPGSSDFVVFYLSGEDLIREIFPDALSTRPSGTKKLASYVTGLVITYDNMDYSLVTQIDTDLTIQEDAKFQTRSITASSKSRIRNK